MFAKSFIALDDNGRLTGARTAQTPPYERYVGTESSRCCYYRTATHFYHLHQDKLFPGNDISNLLRRVCNAVTQFSMRSTTVSNHVSALLEKRLLTGSLRPRENQGCPTIGLFVNPHRLVVMVFKVISQYLQIAYVNLACQILHLEQLHAPADCGNSALGESFNTLLKNAASYSTEQRNQRCLLFAARTGGYC
ncbi:Uncharacterised protein [Yersinia intermedia]|uniref:hypothetical protein n=1 Tax=Yersinia intermedia TaxID=631 RepID=UPI0005E32060|nr:hypothetical protein [Yersinia intermedia]CND45055.1 Uncharacterised protein [Yersinia intermedia]